MDLGDELTIAIAQLNPIVGDIKGNAEKVRSARGGAACDEADLVVFPELFIAGYPVEDLVLKPSFVEVCRKELEELARETTDGGPAVLVGFPEGGENGVYNAIALLDGGEIKSIRRKVDLPNYGVFDDFRVFIPGDMPGPIDFRGVRVGAPICEDSWKSDVSECLMETGAEILIVPNGSPYCRNKAEERLQLMIARVVETGLPLIYVNQVCGQDELVFDGRSFGLNADRSLAFQMPAFVEAVAVTKWQRNTEGWHCTQGPMTGEEGEEENDWRACVLALRDYVEKNRFTGVVLGLSGGIDSAICAAMAVDALGAARVYCVMLPYQYTAQDSLEDAAGCARALGVRYDVIPIEEAVKGVGASLEAVFSGTESDVTEENIQSRIRGLLLMSISNKFGHMVITTGNKSEMSVGYATLYGDMNGGYNPIKDLYKTQVYRLAVWRNLHRPDGMLGPDSEVIPVNIITKAPSAELRPDQTDQDNLPPYNILDDILECLVEREMSLEEIIAKGHDRHTVQHIEHLLYIAEYKRRQAPPGAKITQRNFGRDRRYPITNAFRDR